MCEMVGTDNMYQRALWLLFESVNGPLSMDTSKDDGTNTTERLNRIRTLRLLWRYCGEKAN